MAALIAGGNWNNGANAGARAVNCNNYPWNVNGNIVFMLAVDMLIKVNLIGFIPEAARNQLGLTSVGVAEFFALLYIAYEVVSIFKNMALCGLPVKKVWATVRAFLGKYTDELPDTDELDGNSTTGSVERYRQQEK